MTSNQKTFVTLGLLLALSGAGCSFFGGQSNPTPQPPAVPTAPAPTTPGAPTGPTSEAPGPATDATSTLPAIDDTWVTYTSKSLGFSFKTPTKGTLAPTWEVTFVKAGDPNLVDGCYQWRGQAGSRKLKVGETEFCHTGGIEPAAGNRYWTDYYLANIKNTLVLITFNKHTYVGDNYENTACHGKYVVNDSCSGFKTPEEYYAHLDQIMGTFTLAP